MVCCPCSACAHAVPCLEGKLSEDWGVCVRTDPSLAPAGQDSRVVGATALVCAHSHTHFN